MTRPPMTAPDHIRDLVQGFTTTERIQSPQLVNGTWTASTRLHHVTHPSLLDQLNEAITMAAMHTEGDAFRPAYGSKPTARIDALDVLQRIDTQSHRLACDAGFETEATTRHPAHKLPLRDRLTRLSGVIGDRPHPVVTSWWVAARVATQWETPAFKPRGAICPVEECEQVGTLRIRLDQQIATCTACGSFWDGRSGVENLGRHVAWCLEHELGRPRHLVLDEQEQLVDCPDCAPVRMAMGERARSRAEADAVGRLTA